MTMEMRYGASPADIAGFDTGRLRAEFLVEGRFAPGEIRFTYTHFDRMIVGGACPAGAPLTFGEGAGVGTEHFFTAREMGVANLGAPGAIEIDGTAFALDNRDILYIGRGARRIVLRSDNPENPAKFYMNSTPAGGDISHRVVRKAQARQIELGDAKHANKRRLAMYIHPQVAPSCLLLMGITDLAPGSVWNTMPPHLHDRRMEAYCYFELAEADRVMHFMGRPENTRHLVVADGDIVLSPAWSVHMGAGTGPYAFVWGMTGENQAYTDVEPVPVSRLL